jgi:hypothetical protein
MFREFKHGDGTDLRKGHVRHTKSICNSSHKWINSLFLWPFRKSFFMSSCPTTALVCSRYHTLRTYGYVETKLHAFALCESEWWTWSYDLSVPGGTLKCTNSGGGIVLTSGLSAVVKWKILYSSSRESSTLRTDLRRCFCTSLISSRPYLKTGGRIYLVEYKIRGTEVTPSVVAQLAVLLFRVKEVLASNPGLETY